VSDPAHRQHVVVGGGLAGTAAALEARQIGLETCLRDDPSPPPMPPGRDVSLSPSLLGAVAERPTELPVR
jgi:flavin-dependent dehydrogenase